MSNILRVELGKLLGIFTLFTLFVILLEEVKNLVHHWLKQNVVNRADVHELHELLHLQFLQSLVNLENREYLQDYLRFRLNGLLPNRLQLYAHIQKLIVMELVYLLRKILMEIQQRNHIVIVLVVVLNIILNYYDERRKNNLERKESRRQKYLLSHDQPLE